MIDTTGPRSAARIRALPERRVVLEPLAAADGLAPIDVAEMFRDLPGVVLLESARPARNARWSFLSADPVAVLEDPSEGSDLFADARTTLRRLDAGLPAETGSPLSPFVGGLVGYVGYDVGRRLERLPEIAIDDQPLPPMRLALHDWVICWDRVARRTWLGGRAVDGDVHRLTQRLEEVRGRVEDGAPIGSMPAASRSPDGFVFRSSLDRGTYVAGVQAIRAAIGRGEIYQANLTRRLETPFDGDPWPLYRRLRTGDPARFAAYLDLGRDASTRQDGPNARRGVRAILSASPEPFLSVDAFGAVATDPIKGTRPRGRTPDDDRRLAAELLASAKDRAENVMIVDVLRNDLGRVCRPGTVRVPRLLRLERTASVQHLVTTITGRLARGRDAFDLLGACFPGGSITGAPKIRAMEILERLEPVRRGPYTGALGWFGPDGSMATSILIRTLVADGRRLTLHVGGGITWRSDPSDEWDETVAKAAGPLGAIGGREA